jgi:hypothetical protein
LKLNDTKKIDFVQNMFGIRICGVYALQIF